MHDDKLSKYSGQALCGLVLALGACGVFILPWLVPPAKRVLSDSYNLGFNNAIAILAVGLTLLALCAIRMREIVSSPRLAAELARLLDNPHAGRLAKRELYLPALWGAVVCAFIAAWWFLLPYHYFGEMQTFLPCSELILLGRQPYTQFQFNYGPLLLYLPVWFVRLSGGGLGADAGYLISFLLCTLGGFLLLAYCVTPLTPALRPWGFVCLAAPFSLNALGMGLNYTALRFATPLAALLALHVWMRDLPDNRPPRLALRCGLAFAAGAILCFAISPETGLGFFMGALVYTALLARSQPAAGRARLALGAGLGIAMTALFLFRLSSVYFLSLWSFGSGGFNFPVLPSPPNLLYLASLTVAIPLFGAFGFTVRSPGAALAAGWAAIATIFVAPALGRCDPGHVLCNGLGAFLACLILLQLSHVHSRRIYRTLLALCFIGLPMLWIATYISPFFLGALQARAAGARKCDRRFWKPASPAEQAATASFERLLGPYPKIGAPLGCEENLEIYLKRSGRFIPEYYPAPAAAYAALTPAQTQRKIEDIRRMPFLVVRIESLSPVRQAEAKARYTQLRGAFLSELLLFPIRYRWRNEPFFPDIEWVNFIRDHFHVVRKIDSAYFLMGRNASAPKAAS
jgi:hypothetical protein